MSYAGQVLVPVNNISFSNLNFISNTSVNTVGTASAMFVPGASGDHIVGQYISAPSTPYCVIANIVPNQGDFNGAPDTQVFGMGFYDGTKLVMITPRWSGNITMGITVYECSSVTTIASKVYGTDEASGFPSSDVHWFQLRDDGTNIYFYVAFDAGANKQPTHWVQIYSQARTSYLSNVNYVAWLCDSNVSGVHTYQTLNSWQAVSL